MSSRCGSGRSHSRAIGREFAGFPGKFFIHGSMIYLLGDALGRLFAGDLDLVALLLTTSGAETWLAGRSADHRYAHGRDRGGLRGRCCLM
jgi:hypothetical protein